LSAHPLTAWAALVLGGFCLSWASILIKWCALPPLAIATWRLLLAALLMSVWPAARRQLALSWWRVGVGGLLLAVHFASWIASLRLLPVFLSVTLVTTSPLWVELGALALWKEPLSARRWAALATAFGGSALLSWHGPGAGASGASGILLALVGAWSMAAYLLWARVNQPAAGAVNYAWRVYSTAALLLLGISVINGVALGPYPAEQWALLGGLAVIPQVLGHTFLLLAVRYGSASLAALTILLEPVGSILLAALLLGETLQPLQWTGVGVTLSGLLLRAFAPEETAPIDRAEP
jgi:drug/metabolite transporter (DMT)-like permease